MGAVEKSANVKVRKGKKNGFAKQKFGKFGPRNGQHPPSPRPPFPPFSSGMRPRPPFMPGRMPGPGMRPPPPGMRMPPPPGPPPLFRNRVPPPPRMGPRGGMPPMNMRPRPRPPLMGPPPLMRPPPPMMGPRRFPPPPMMPPGNKMRQLKNKMNPNNKRNQKKKNPQNQIDLSSPWVTPQIKAEYDNKDKFYLAAKASSKQEDWDKFKAQRLKCDKIYKTAKLEYIGKHPEEVYEEENTDEYLENAYEEDYNYEECYSEDAPNYEENYCENSSDYQENYSESSSHYEANYSENSFNYEGCYSTQSESAPSENPKLFCDPCEKGFSSFSQLQVHLKEHRVCGIDGCKFVAHSKIVEKHISMQHETGLYYRIAKSDSPEDIAKWRAERKKRYPTKENIEKRRSEQEEMVKRGERIFEPKDRFGRKNKKDTSKKSRFKNKKNKNKLSNLKKMPPKLKKLDKKPTVSLLNDKSSWNGKLQPFPGTSELYESENEATEKEDKFDDSEWLTEQQDAPKIELKNALGALIGAYRSSDESDNEINVPEVNILTQKVPKIEEIIPKEDNNPKEENLKGNNPKEDNQEKDNLKEDILKEDVRLLTEDEAPEEKKIIKEKAETYLEKKSEKGNQNKPKRNRKRKRKHSRSDNSSKKKTLMNNLSQNQSSCSITLLEKLLAPDIRHERNLILQCVRYVVKNNFFDTQTKNSTLVPEEKILDDENLETETSVKEDSISTSCDIKIQESAVQIEVEQIPQIKILKTEN